MLVREWLQQLGVAPATIALLEARYPTQRISRQLEWLRYRSPRDPAAMLVSAVQGDWAPPMWHGDDDPLHPPENASILPEPMTSLSGMDDLPREEGFTGTPIRENGDGFLIEGTATDARAAWTQLLAEIRLQMTRVTFDTWMGGTQVAGVHGDVVSVLVRDGYAAEWLQARWKQPIERTLSAIAGCPLSVRFLGPNVER